MATGSSSPDEDVPIATLYNGISMPLLGLGCASGVRKSHVATALETGYRLLDTAQAYRWGYHEDEVGSALTEFLADDKNDRNLVFVQTKVDPESLGYDATIRAVEKSLERLNGHLDSVLIHKPRCWEGACSRQPEGTWQESYRALEDFYDRGVIKAIGICDVDDRLLDELLRQRIKPHIIQNWMDPLHQDKRIRERCLANGIQYQGYSTLGPQWVHFKGFTVNPVLENPVLVDIAKNHNVDVASVVLNWALKHGISVLPASRNAGRQRSNLESGSLEIDLSEDEMTQIDNLDGKLEQKVQLHFENPRQDGGEISTFWVASNKKDSEEVFTGSIVAGGKLSLTSYHGHRFIFRDPTNGNTILGDYTVDAVGSGEQSHTVPYESEL